MNQQVRLLCKVLVGAWLASTQAFCGLGGSKEQQQSGASSSSSPYSTHTQESIDELPDELLQLILEKLPTNLQAFLAHTIPAANALAHEDLAYLSKASEDEVDITSLGAPKPAVQRQLESIEYCLALRSVLEVLVQQHPFIDRAITKLYNVQLGQCELSKQEHTFLSHKKLQLVKQAPSTERSGIIPLYVTYGLTATITLVTDPCSRSTKNSPPLSVGLRSEQQIREYFDTGIMANEGEIQRNAAAACSGQHRAVRRAITDIFEENT